MYPERGVSYVDLRPDRVAMQDATAQMAWLQFMTRRARRGAGAHDHPLRPPDHRPAPTPGADLLAALSGNDEVYDFLRSAVCALRRRLLEAGLGIIHQVVLENYAFPGGMMIGTDSHTPNAGGPGHGGGAAWAAPTRWT